VPPMPPPISMSPCETAEFVSGRDPRALDMVTLAGRGEAGMAAGDGSRPTPPNMDVLAAARRVLGIRLPDLAMQGQAAPFSAPTSVGRPARRVADSYANSTHDHTTVQL